MAAQVPVGETAILFKGLYYKLWSVRYDATATTFTVNSAVTSICVIEPASGAPSVSLGSPANGVKTATIASGGSAKGDGTVTLVTVHGTTIGTGANG
jgi:hypothetical protein